MARVRTRVQRSFYLLIALCILMLLLQLNTLLPGVWKGGGEGGFRAGGDFGLLDPTRGTPDGAPTPDAADAGAIEPPTEPPDDWPPRDGLVVQVIGPDGDLREGWRLGVGGSGGQRAADDGSLTVRDKRIHGEGFRVRDGRTTLRHRHGLDVPATRYVVHVPRGEVPSPRRADPVEVQVVDPASGEPVPGARIGWTAGGQARDATTDAEGKARVQGEGVDPFPVRVTKEGRIEQADVIVRPQRRGATRIPLAVATPRAITFRWTDRRPAAVTRVLVYSDDRRLLADARGARGTASSEIRFTLPEHELDGAHMAVLASGTDVDGYRVSMPLRGVGAEVLLPNPRTLRIVARDVQGRPVADASVVVATEWGEDDETAPLAPFRTRTNRQGEARVSVAPGQGVHVTVQKDRLGPATRRLSAVDGSDTLELVLDDGVMIPVRVRPAGGEGLLRSLEARASVNGVRVRQGRLVLRDHPVDEVAYIGPFPPGPVELYVGAHGHAWSARILDAKPAMATVDVPLEKAYPLMVVVEDAFGVAIEGATIELTVVDGGEPLVVSPTAYGLVTDARGRAGLPNESGISGSELPDRVYEARISAPGYGPQVIRRLRPGGALHFVTLLPVK